ncbi:collectin-12-like [Pecten maximus]|uniref:collectin-12-like n=1 Tax=Pecten maximus TaxID=6579 RepID=UPI00145886A1|nr:collectin-12-like [Pecten maximus]
MPASLSCFVILVTAQMLQVFNAVVNANLLLERNDVMDNWFPQTSVTTVGVVRTVSECGLHCAEAGWCMAMIYDVTNKICYLNDQFSTNISESYWRPNTTNYKVTNAVPSGFNCGAFTGSCATVLSVTSTWSDAVDACAEKSSRLLLIESATKQLEIEQYMDDEGLSYAWIGLSDVTTEGQWLDSDGGVAVYTNFKPSQPDNAGSGQHCALLRKDFGFKWDDVHCNNNHYVICEMIMAV